MSKDYDIEGAFQRIEEELINSMLRNYKRHRAWEKEEGFNWSMWQAEQLKSLQAYRKNNKSKFSTYFSTINDEVEEMIKKSYAAGNMDQEIKILKAIRRGYEPFSISEKVREFIQEYKGKPLKDIAGDIISRIKGERTAEFNGEFFKINDRKLNALLKATKEDFSKAEIAMLRKANDEYRKTIFNAQVYANTGAGTMEQAVDMATKDFLSKGINCIEYKNGARVNIVDYVAMALRTANKRAYLQGEGAKRAEWGIHTVIVTKRGGGCPKCVPFQGKVFIDDVWSGGSSKDGNYPLLSAAMKAGLFHPNCKDTCTTFFPGINTEPNPPSKEEQKKSIEIYNLQQKQKYAERMIRKYKNLEAGSLDEDNRKKYKSKKIQWEGIKKELSNKMSTINDSIWPKSGTLISKEEYKELRGYAESKGIVLSEFKKFDGDVVLVKEIIDDMSMLANKYPILKDKKKPLTLKLQYYMQDEDFAQSKKHIICINGKMLRSKEILKNYYLNLSEEKWFTANTSYRAIVKHEIGHTIHDLYKINTIDISKKILNVESEKELFIKLKSYLSIYSSTRLDGSEILSEVFAEFYDSKKPRGFSLKFMEEVDKIIKRS